MKRSIILTLMLLASCSSGEVFGEEDQRAFLAGCVEGGGTEELCECMVDEIQERLTDDELKELADSEPEDLQTNPRFLEAVRACVESTDQ